VTMLRQARFKTVPHSALTLQDCMRKAVLENVTDARRRTPWISPDCFRELRQVHGQPTGTARLFLVQIFARNIVFRYLVGMNFLLVSVLSALDTGNDIGFERIPFLDQLVDALRIRNFEAGQSL